MVNRVIIFTEGGDNIGFGHITRCSALYEELLERKIETIFVVYGKNIEDILKGKNYINKDWKDKEFLQNFLKKDDYVIIDSYLADLDIYEYVSQNVKKVLCIDDYNRIKYPLKALTINLCFKKLEQKNYYFGSKYLILRKEFLKFREISKKDKEILILIGGNDIRDITMKIVKIIKQNFPDYSLNVISKNREIDKYLSITDKRYFNLSADEIIKLIEKSYIAISACGQTLFELTKIGIATLGIKIAENQNDNISYFTKERYLEYMGSFDDEFFENNLLRGFKVLENKEENKKRVDIGKNLTKDINGAKEIIKLLLEENFENNNSNN